MEELIKELHWLCQVKGFSSERAIDLMKIETLRQISNMLSVIEGHLSDLLNTVETDSADSEAATKLMEKLMGKELPY